MKPRMEPRYLAGVLLAFSFALSLPSQAAVDDADALKLLKDSKCLKCHDIEKTKKGKSFKKVAAEYGDARFKPNAVAEVTKHVTEPSTVESDGEQVDHGIVKTRDAARIRNLVEWILSR
jgi:cytochrome c